MRLFSLLFAAALLCPSAPAAEARGAELVDRLLDRIVDQEHRFIDRMRAYQPFMETYIQAADDEKGAAPGAMRDHYLMGKVSVTDLGVDWQSFAQSDGFEAREKFLFFKLPRKQFLARGFAQMIAPDVFELNRETYEFEYLRREFLGEVRALVFNVRPREAEGGRFVGRIWVEDRDYRIVRFNGAYTQRSKEELYFHFDSWRRQVEPDLWVPSFVYVQDEDRAEQVGGRFRAQSRFWNYNPVRDGRLEELTAILIGEDEAAKDSSGAEDVTPLESRREWVRQAEDNVLQRLERTGLLAPRGPVDDVLETVANNLIATNDLGFEVRCRVLLTTPLETFSVGQSIVISRGLIDVLPDEASLAMAISDELAHIALGHRTETMFAFSDFTIFEDAEILDRMRLDRSPEEIEAAGVKALEMLERSPYGDKLSQAGLFLKALERRAPHLPNLIRSNFGNSLASPDRLLRLAELAEQAPELDEERLEQIAALPLGSRVRLDPWTNEIALKEARPVELRTAKDKMPFEVTPFMPYLTRLE
ncbi:MAG: hypothetical protein H6509_02265 [Bryobacterales bacterium]|nr:hypothetical protein [Bryobacterales bacterium]